VGDSLWQRVIPVQDLNSGQVIRVSVAGRNVMLVCLEDGTVAAASPICPHQGEDLTAGKLYMGAIDCPGHHYLYDLHTGENRYPRNVFPADLGAELAPLRLYPTKIEEGWIWVQASRER
jgi:3-phenylpropionate/trans-cinnamate dioxygenase ferredoxin component